MVSKQKTLTFFGAVDEIRKSLEGKEILIFLDYDGTLTPIVDTPDQAVLSEDTRERLVRLAGKYAVSVVSGRQTDDVRAKVNIQNIFYAGSHGFEIVRPDGEAVIHPEAQRMRPLIEEVYQKLEERLRGVKGALVEDVKYTISVHYRLVSQEDISQVKDVVQETVKAYPQFVATSGKRVLEVRPKIDWHKGKAVQWILDFLQFQPDRNKVVYIGDDRTDEDAFEAIKDIGIGVRVADSLEGSQAQYYVRNVGEVKEVLEFFNSLKS